VSFQKILLSNLVVNLESGSRPKGGVDEDGDIPSLGAEHLDDDGGFKFKKIKKIKKEFFDNMRTGHIKKNDILIVKDGATTGKVSIVNDSFPFVYASVNEHVFILRVNQNISSPEYVFNFLKTKSGKDQILKDFRGATVGGISRTFTDKVEIPLPPLSEQKLIASILEKANGIKVKRELALAKLNELAECTFIEMFGDPLTNPMKWVEVKLNDICNAISDIDHKMPKAVEVGIPFISAKDLQDNDKLSFEKVKFISQKDFLHLSRKIKPSKGDIIYSRIGANLGKARLVDVDIDFVVSYSCCTIKPKLEVVNAKYLCKLLDLPATLEQAKKGTHSIAVPDLGIGEIKNFKIILPPLEMQKKYSDFLDKLKLQKNIISASQSYSEDLIQSLQNQAFTTGFNA
jgi:type I restriction enzyme S subunit